MLRQFKIALGALVEALKSLLAADEANLFGGVVAALRHGFRLLRFSIV